MAQNRDQILQIIAQNKSALRRFGVRALGLFGSAARNENTSASDLDFLVEFEKKTFDVYMDLKFFLEDLFGCKVDLVLKDSIKPRLRERILNETIYATGL